MVGGNPETNLLSHAKAQRRKESLLKIFLAGFAPLRDRILSRSLFVVVISLAIASTTQASPDFTKSEKQALLEFARSCLVSQISGTSAPTPPPCATGQQSACFVTFFTGRRVFACFGGFSPRRTTLAEEISENVRLALKNDSRARNVTTEAAIRAELQITFPVGQPERVENYQSIDPVHEGMFVEGQNGGVAFVPGEARTANWAFREALRRLGEKDPSTVSVFRFKADMISTR